jgi:hypothetical protein
VSVYPLLAAKFLGYTLWSLLGLAWLGRQKPDASGFLAKGIVLGLFRVALGIAFGVGIYVVTMMNNPTGSLGEYIGWYAPVRVIEWAILAHFIGRGTWKAALSAPVPRDPDAPLVNLPTFGWPRVWLWILLGVLLSFGLDSFSPIPVKDHFCTGRCLC